MKQLNMKFVSSLRTRDLLKMLDFLPAAWETGGIRRLGSETVDTSERIIHYYMRPQKKHGCKINVVPELCLGSAVEH